MKRTRILAHRGWWKTPDEKNSFQALKRALETGFGVETDFRDADGSVVISHDPPEGDTLSAKAFFELYSQLGASGRLALNIKADGLQRYLVDLITSARAPLENMFAFDMSVPDGLQYIKTEFPIYTRVSEFEGDSSLVDRATGVWLDNFTGEYPQVAQAKKLLAKGHRACIVSPELHRRDHLALWDEIAVAELHKDPLFELCTDFPQDAYNLLGTE
jgi:glycerophosphoryl diester phosphodiesterase